MEDMMSPQRANRTTDRTIPLIIRSTFFMHGFLTRRPCPDPHLIIHQFKNQGHLMWPTPPSSVPTRSRSRSSYHSSRSLSSRLPSCILGQRGICSRLSILCIGCHRLCLYYQSFRLRPELLFRCPLGSISSIMDLFNLLGWGYLVLL